MYNLNLIRRIDWKAGNSRTGQRSAPDIQSWYGLPRTNKGIDFGMK